MIKAFFCALLVGLGIGQEMGEQALIYLAAIGLLPILL